MAAKDYYAILNIKRDADEKEIKRAYRKLAKKYHPDTNPNNKEAEQKFKEVTEAYNVLSDPEKKKKYDQYGSAAFDGNFSHGFNASDFYGNHFHEQTFHDGSNGFHFHFSGNADDDMFDDLFGSFFHGSTGSTKNTYTNDGFSFHNNYNEKGADAHADIHISFDDAVFGCDKVLQIKTDNSTSSSLKVHIPAGIDEGQSIRLKGKGETGIHGGMAGDLLLKVHVDKKAGYERKGNDVYVTTNIPYPTAVLGGEAIVPTLTGKVSCKIPAGTQSGSKIRLKNKGICSMKDPAKKGDEYLVIQIDVPKHLTLAEQQKLREYDLLFSQHSV